MLDIEHEIRRTIESTAAESGKQLVDGFDERSVLLQCGLDSLDFAIVVARLEESLGADPFSAAEQPEYPRTYGDLVQIYTEFLAGRQ